MNVFHHGSEDASTADLPRKRRMLWESSRINDTLKLSLDGPGQSRLRGISVEGWGGVQSWTRW